MWKKIKPYVIFIALALAVGGLSAWVTRGNMDIYGEINKPPLSPPGFLFPVVWGILYVLMGIGAAIVYSRREKTPVSANTSLRLFGFQLAVNFFWSIIFFNMRAYLFAFIWLLLLWFLILAMILSFRTTSKAAALFQLPYLLWVTFAGYLTIMVYFLNRI